MNWSVCSPASSNSVTVDYWKLKDENIIHGKVFAAFLLFYELVGLPWNVLVLVIIVKEKLRHQPTVILLLNLLVADLFLLLYPSPILMTTGFAGEFIIGSSDKVRCGMCQLGFTLLVPFYSTLFTVALMSLDRFLYIHKPFWYERTSTKYVALTAVVIAILSSIAIGLGVRFDLEKAEFDQSNLNCSKKNPYYSSLWYAIVLVAICVAMLMIIIVSNISFASIVLKNIRAVYSRDNITDGTKQSRWTGLKMYMKTPRYKKQTHLYGMVLTLLLSSLIIWIPFLYDVGIFIVPNSPDPPVEVSILASILLFSQVIIHPITETVLIPGIRRPLKDLVTCGIFKRKNNGLLTKDDGYKCCHSCMDKKGHCCFLMTLLEAGLIPQNMPANQNENCHS